MDSPNPCLGCGACCAYFRASFYWAEADDATPGGVPAGLTIKLTALLRAMRGTNQQPPRCVALFGDIGVNAGCGIYERRSSICRSFTPAWANGEPNERCDKARRKWGLGPLTPESWISPQPHNSPKAA
jgi:Fe-S-cluster containining protein